MEFDFKPLKRRVRGVKEAKEALSLMRSMHDRCEPSPVKERLLALINMLDNSLNAFLPDEKFFSEMEPVLVNFLANAKAEDIEIILKDEDVINLIGGVDDFVLKYYSEKFVTLQELIYRFMREKGIDKPSDVWKPVGLGRRTFHKLLNQYNERYSQAPRIALLQLSVGLRLNFDETSELLEHQFYRLTRSKTDLVFAFFAMRRKPDKEKDFVLVSKREMDAIREKLRKEGIEIPEVYD